MIEWNIGPHLKFRRGKLQSRVTSFCIDLDFGYINNVIFHNRRFGTCICVWIPPFFH